MKSMSLLMSGPHRNGFWKTQCISAVWNEFWLAALFFPLSAGRSRYVWWIFVKLITLHVLAYLNDTITHQATSASPSRTLLGNESAKNIVQRQETSNDWQQSQHLWQRFCMNSVPNRPNSQLPDLSW